MNPNMINIFSNDDLVKSIKIDDSSLNQNDSSDNFEELLTTVNKDQLFKKESDIKEQTLDNKPEEIEEHLSSDEIKSNDTLKEKKNIEQKSTNSSEKTHIDDNANIKSTDKNISEQKVAVIADKKHVATVEGKASKKIQGDISISLNRKNNKTILTENHEPKKINVAVPVNTKKTSSRLTDPNANNNRLSISKAKKDLNSLEASALKGDDNSKVLKSVNTKKDVNILGGNSSNKNPLSNIANNQKTIEVGQKISIKSDPKRLKNNKRSTRSNSGIGNKIATDNSPVNIKSKRNLKVRTDNKINTQPKDQSSDSPSGKISNTENQNHTNGKSSKVKFDINPKTIDTKSNQFQNDTMLKNFDNINTKANEALKMQAVKLVPRVTNVIVQFSDNNGMQKMETLLDGGDLGEINLKLFQEKTDSKAIIVVETESAKSVMKNIVSTIKENLAQKGLSFASFEVEVNQNKKGERDFNQKDAKGIKIITEVASESSEVSEAPRKRNFGYNSIEVVA